MKRVSKLPLLAVVLLTACNEQVSPELQNAGVTTTSSPTPTTSTSTTYSFKLTNVIADTASFHLHKTGAGNKDAECSVTTTNVPFSRNTFPTDSGGNSFDITCYLEAEELALYEKGLTLKIDAAPNTCEYIEYTPFGFYNRIPGDSTATYDLIKCGNTSTTSGHIVNAASLLTPALDVSYSGGGTASCDEYLSNNPAILANANRLPFTTEDENELCRFNYTDGDEEKCDIGTVTINDYTFTLDETAASAAAASAGRTACVANPANITCNTYLDATDDDGTGPDDGAAGFSDVEIQALLSTADADFAPAYNAVYNSYVPAVTKTTRKIACGGKTTNCLEGPAKVENKATALTASLLPVPTNTAGTLTVTYPTLLPNRAGTYIYANYRRNLANSSINYIQTDDAGYDNAWMNALLSLPHTNYDPALMQQYSFGGSFSTPPTITTWTNADWQAASIVDNKTVGVPLASEPMQGMKYIFKNKVVNYGVNPFYTWNCLDAAREIKARIRLLVRDWNRLLPSVDTTPFEYLTDRPITPIGAVIDDPFDWPRQDIDVIEPDDGSGVANSFNDYMDWDDILGMKITAGKYTVRLNPPYNTDVFFDPSGFPNEDKD